MLPRFSSATTSKIPATSAAQLEDAGGGTTTLASAAAAADDLHEENLAARSLLRCRDMPRVSSIRLPNSRHRPEWPSGATGLAPMRAAFIQLPLVGRPKVDNQG